MNRSYPESQQDRNQVQEPISKIEPRANNKSKTPSRIEKPENRNPEPKTPPGDIPSIGEEYTTAGVDKADWTDPLLPETKDGVKGGFPFSP